MTDAPQPATTTTTAGSTAGTRRLALLALQAGVAVVTIDISLTSTALPAIAAALGTSPAAAIWIVNAYYLAVVAALLPMGALGEIHGHGRIFRAGLLAFAAGALACGLAWSLPSLAAARAVSGIGAAAVAATTPALVRALYPPGQLGRGLGLYALVVGVALAAGPVAASAILALAQWPWLFLAGLPVILAVLAAPARILPPTERSARRLDAMAAALCAAMFALLLLAIAGVAHRAAWPAIALAGALAAACAVALWRREADSAAPILALDLFRIPVFALSAATSACAFSIQGLAFVAMPLLLQARLGYSQVEIGLLVTPWPAMVVATTLVVARLADRLQPGLLGGAGLLAMAPGLATLAALGPGSTPLAIALALAACGAGFAFFQSPNMRALMASAPRHRGGGAGGILATARVLGQSLGAALVALCLGAQGTDGLATALWIGAGLALCGSATSALRLLPGLRRGE
ncbi:MAG: MFS transporter [Alphaproteobacteria bacterium]